MLITDSGNSGNFENPLAGSYGATCRQIIDLGTQESDYQGVKSHKHQILVGWELDELMEDGRPFVVSKFYTASLNEKANFRQDLISWRGRDFTNEELGGFDPANILGAPCMLSLILTEKGKIKVQNVSKLPKGMTVPPLVNPKIYFSLMHGKYDQQVFDNLSEGIKKIIMQSPEYLNRQQEVGKMPSNNISVTPQNDIDDEFLDDLPF